MHLGKERNISEFKVTDKMRVEEVGAIIKVINAPKEKTSNSYLNNRKGSLRIRPHYLRLQSLQKCIHLKEETELRVEIKGLNNSYLGKWFPSPKAIKHLHFCREGIKFLRDLESFPRVSTCKKDVPGYFADEQVLGK